MGFLKWLLVLIFQFYYLYGLNIAQPSFISDDCGEADYFPNSTYQTNLNTLLSSVASNINSYGFYNGSIGQNLDKVSVVAQCRGDIDLKTCRDCIINATSKIVKVCAYKKIATGFYDYCLLRYSNESIIGTMSNVPLHRTFTSQNASSREEFIQDLRTLLENLRGQASEDGNYRMYASGNISGPDFQTIYAFVQCTMDLSGEDCFNCVSAGYISLPNCSCYGNIGVNFMMPSCNFRYAIYPFHGVKTEAAPPIWPPPPPTSPSGKNDKTRILLIIVVNIGIVIMLGLCIYTMVTKRQMTHPRTETRNTGEGMRLEDISTAESLQYDFTTIKAATDSFSIANKLGQGGFGPVYKGKLPNGKEVAVKKMSRNSGQGDLEFKNEVMFVARLQHRNLVKLLGFCLHKTERLLVYEFVPNASLDHFIFDTVKREHLNWNRRYKIIGGIARGILYLHEDSRLLIIHRDLKASNVLLDSEMNPKISDFGLAKEFTLDESQGNITSRIAGTMGYMAPEYLMHGQFSVKSDVFSFGILVIEIISGQKNSSFRNGPRWEPYVSYVWRQWHEGTTSNLIDPILLKESSGLARHIIRCIQIALLCVQENVADRPTMAAVILMLSSLSPSLPAPSVPSYVTQDNVNSPDEISVLQENYSTMSQNEASISELYPR